MDFDSLFRRHYPPLFRYLDRLTGDADRADECAQEAFVRLLAQTIPEDKVRAWLFRVATNRVRDIARVRGRREELLQEHDVSPAQLAGPEESLERQERIAAVRRALQELAERDRAMLLLREEGMSYREIAEAVEVAPGSVGTLLARALQRFREVYTETEAAHGLRD